MNRLRYNELALEAMRWATVKPATRDAVAQVNRCVEEMQKLRGHTAPPVDRRGTLPMNTLEEQDRAEDLRKQEKPTCPTCRGRGWDMDCQSKFRPVTCPDCAGSGKFEHSITVHESDVAAPDVSALAEAPHRAEDLRKAYAARRVTHADPHYLRDQREPDLAELIATHSIHLAPYDAIVYARIDTREVGVKYSAVGGDKAKAVRLAVREVLRLVGVAQ